MDNVQFLSTYIFVNSQLLVYNIKYKKMLKAQSNVDFTVATFDKLHYHYFCLNSILWKILVVTKGLFLKY